MSRERIPKEMRQRVRDFAGDRCAYCRSPQHLVYGSLEIEHIVPRAKQGLDKEENLCLACRLCNNFKGVQTEAIDPITGQLLGLFNPRAQRWSEARYSSVTD
jgi:5-methylcytosine-specific restriction endonuclease McrA